MTPVQLPERVYCSDVLFPMAVVGLANRRIKLYKLDGAPQEFNDIESPLKFQVFFTSFLCFCCTLNKDFESLVHALALLLVMTFFCFLEQMCVNFPQ